MTERLGRRVAVTGIGVLANCGIGKEAFWSGLLGPAPTGERRIHDFDPEPYFDSPKDARRTDRFAQFAMAGAAMAVADAGEPVIGKKKVEGEEGAAAKAPDKKK